MINDFEEKKKILYIANALANKKYVKNNIENVAEWLANDGILLCKYNFFDEQEELTKDDFLAFYRKNKLKTVKMVTEYAEKLRQKYALSTKIRPAFLEKNLCFLQELFALNNEEKEILGFFIRSNCDDYLEDVLSDLKARHSRLTPTERAIFTGISPDKIYQICSKNSYLTNLGLIEFEYDGNIEITGFAKTFYYQKFKNTEDIKRYILGRPLKKHLEWQDFKHLKKINTLKKILNAALQNNEKGINVLLYGEPGTGKTEFAKTLAEVVCGTLYPIGETAGTSLAEEDESSRYKQLIRANILLKNDKRACLLVDEADDILTSCYQSFFFYSKRDRETSKIKVNRLLENNAKPTIWISNDIHTMDKAYLRRFSYAINFTRPSKAVLEEMWQKSLQENNLPCNKKTVETFARKYSLSPSFINTATKATRLIKGNIAEVEQTLDVLQEAYNNGEKLKTNISDFEIDFNPKLLNTDINLEILAKRLTTLGKLNFSLCLYGASGTGKSAFAQYLGKQMGLPIIKKRCSDLLDKFVGEAEKNIAKAFEEAKQRGALLIFDEADSFLQDRSSAQRSWEITQVNEMLTQMEKHTYPFVCTTNLMDTLDKASLRRFTFKVKYDYMTSEQCSAAFKHFFNIPNIDLSHLNLLTPGDFVVVKDKAEILGLTGDKEELLKMLEAEQQNKTPVSRKIGFI